MKVNLRILGCLGVGLFSLAAMASGTFPDGERMEDCVGATPEAMFVPDQYTDYKIVTKNKFMTIESGTLDGQKIVLTSTRCTRAIREFEFEFPAAHKLSDSSYWLKQGVERLRALKVKPLFHRLNGHVITALKGQAKNRAPASVVKGRKWEKPLTLTIRENYESVRVNLMKKGETVLMTITHDTAM